MAPGNADEAANLDVEVDQEEGEGEPYDILNGTTTLYILLLYISSFLLLLIYYFFRQ